MKQHIALLSASVLLLGNLAAPAAYAKPAEHSTNPHMQAQTKASDNASFNRTGSAGSIVTVPTPVSTTLQPQPVATTAPADPAGNNDIIKIDGQPFDTDPNNEPHVGCTFQIDFSNYDAGNRYADVILEAHAPTGSRQILADRVFIGQDSAGGGTDIDAQPTYNLSGLLAGLSPHPHQGYHLKATIHADGSQGADVKHKVFWAKCAQPVGGKGSGPVAAQPAAEPTVMPATIPSFTGTLPRTGDLSAFFLPIVAGLLGAVYAYLRQKYLSENQ